MDYAYPIKGNYAFAQTSILRTTELKVNFEKLVETGSDQNIRVKVKDLGSGDPVSSATVTITIYFPGGVNNKTIYLAY